jgi:uncharacterized repeat protein (TIGR02543 family)
VDIAVVFPDDIETTQNFWDSLPSQIATLHQKGTKVIRSLDIRVFYKDVFEQNQMEQEALTPMESNEAGYLKRAQEIRDGLLNYEGLDGVAINAEAFLTQDDVERAAGVIRALSAYYGPLSTSSENSILAYNTNEPGTTSLFESVYQCVSYVFADAYGRSVERVQADWESFEGKILSSQYIPGFTFYEERGTQWHDTDDPLATSRAAAYAEWEPQDQESLKGGIFGYAADRDGAQPGDDEIVFTTFEWTKTLAKIMNKLSYDGNGAESGKVVSQAARVGSSLIVAENSYEKTGYTFTGWNSAADGSGTAYSAGETVEVSEDPLTLYAQWQASPNSED